MRSFLPGRGIQACSRVPAFSFAEAFLCTRLLVAENDFAVAYELVVEPEAILEGCGFEAGSWWTAEQANAGRRLEDIRGEGATVRVEFDAQVAGVGKPGDLVARIEHDDLRDKSNQYGTFGHCVVRAAMGAAGSLL